MIEDLAGLEGKGPAQRSGGGPLRVLHVITALGRGGAENHLLELVKDQSSRGWLLAVAYLKPPEYWADPMRALGVRVLHLGMRRYGDLRPLRRLRAFVREFRPELIHAHLPPAELYSRLALLGSWGAAIPLVITKHNDEPFCGWPGERLLGRWVARRARRVIAISEAVRAYMSGPALGLGAEKTEVIHYGIDPAPFQGVPGAVREKIRGELGFSPEDLVVGFIGRLVPQKDLQCLVRAVQLFCRNHPEGRLLIVGTGPEEKSLKRIVEMSGLSGRVVWAGFREDIPALLSGMDILALSSQYEGFGLVLLEAMAAGKPVLASRVSAIPEVVDEGLTGVLATSGDPEAFAGGLVRLSAPEERKRMGAAGVQRVRARFSLGTMCGKTCSLYWGVLGAGEEGGGRETH